MAYPASQQTLSDGFQLANATANRLRGQVLQLRNASESASVSRAAILNLMRLIDEGIDRWAQVAAIPGIVDYARAQFANQSIDVAAEFTTMRNAAIALRDWIDANFPRHADGSVAVFEQSAGTDFLPVDKTFTSAQLATFRTNADTFIATIS